MKKTIFLIFLMITAVQPARSFAEYKCLLKSGEEFFASDYWVDKIDNSVLRFEVKGSLVRMPRNLFNYISPVDKRSAKVRTAIKRITFQNSSTFNLQEVLSRATGTTVSAEDGDSTVTETALARRIETEVDAQGAPAPSAEDNLPPTDNTLEEQVRRIQADLDNAKDEYRKALKSGDASQRQNARQKIIDMTELRNKLLEQVKKQNP